MSDVRDITLKFETSDGRETSATFQLPIGSSSSGGETGLGTFDVQYPDAKLTITQIHDVWDGMKRLSAIPTQPTVYQYEIYDDEGNPLSSKYQYAYITVIPAGKGAVIHYQGLSYQGATYKRYVKIRESYYVEANGDVIATLDSDLDPIWVSTDNTTLSGTGQIASELSVKISEADGNKLKLSEDSEKPGLYVAASGGSESPDITATMLSGGSPDDVTMDIMNKLTDGSLIGITGRQYFFAPIITTAHHTAFADGSALATGSVSVTAKLEAIPINADQTLARIITLGGQQDYISVATYIVTASGISAIDTNNYVPGGTAIPYVGVTDAVANITGATGTTGDLVFCSENLTIYRYDGSQWLATSFVVPSSSASSTAVSHFSGAITLGSADDVSAVNASGLLGSGCYINAAIYLEGTVDGIATIRLTETPCRSDGTPITYNLIQRGIQDNNGTKYVPFQIIFSEVPLYKMNLSTGSRETTALSRPSTGGGITTIPIVDDGSTAQGFNFTAEVITVPYS